eukprot:Blabericola_migrator_1__7677@NODE_391_length_9042_cov_77_341616_g312_i0_p3_GENE_NODE_391_length_9042_cov_77_341616_g312_i0NODE_391_length_9042_cov_77_341616_g312_i0_p3_ORF_typecomplete_len441_score52_83PP2C/PF00481_21/0_0029PP2C/PF00481_21/4_5e20PP2C_2/PF13672_6/8_3PP2C_2/PF13672_6/0_093DUF1556/PF07590_11/1_6e03DUF1556/PF07590_11/0_22DUF1556/PF07590_11/1_5e04_NODE_391_length_9042_cov_77_341616_g312_i077049026
MPVWEEIDSNWSRCQESGLWLCKPSKWLYELRTSDNTFIPLKPLDDDEEGVSRSILPSKMRKIGAAATMQGRRPRQEDGYILITRWLGSTSPSTSTASITSHPERKKVLGGGGDLLSVDSNIDLDCGLALVCDGHGGNTATDFVLERLPVTLRELLLQSTKYEGGVVHQLRQAIMLPSTPSTSASKEGSTGCPTADDSTSDAERPIKKARKGDSDESIPVYDIVQSPCERNVCNEQAHTETADAKCNKAPEPSAEDPTDNVVEKRPVEDVLAESPGPLTVRPPSRNSISDEIVSDLKQITSEAFDSVDQEFMRVFRTARDGCTAALTYFLGDHVIIANCGDTRVVLATTSDTDGGSVGEIKAPNNAAEPLWYAYRLSIDHKPSLPSERLRITESGGTVRRVGTCMRVLPYGFQDHLKQQDMAALLGKGTRDRVTIALAGG